jgi:succinate-semialdehyde dehydrogenase/glutarate-semialdehyde dehydrogenase
VNPRPMKMYIGGAWVEAASGERFDVIDPATGELAGSVPNGGAADAKAAIDAAQSAYKGWAALTAQKRSELLYRWYSLVMAQKEELARLLTREQGKPLAEARGEIEYGASFILWYAEEAKRVYGQTVPASAPDKRILVVQQPVGVVGAITPWNFPNAMITRKVAPALAAGCTVVLKPAEQTPLSALALAELAEEAGIPAGVFNVVTGDPVAIGRAMLDDFRVRKISFTGSTEVGKLLMRESAETMKRLSLELGGHAPFLVFADADLDAAVEGAIASKFRNAGQTCICANRFIVEASVAEEFGRRLAAAVAKLKVGNGFEDGVSVGPLIDQAALEKVERHVSDAVQRGARVLTGGRRLSEFRTGYFYAPTVLEGVTPEMLVCQEETFGPVAPIIPFTTEEEAIRLANDTRYGLAAYAYTRDLGRAFRVAEGLEYGIVGLNDGRPSTAQAPFGGFKESGLGREGGPWGIQAFLEVKYISLGL